MDMQIDSLLIEAAKLNPCQRAALADALLESIPANGTDEQSVPVDPSIGKAWGEVVARRIAEVDAGEVEMIPVQKALPQKKQHG